MPRKLNIPKDKQIKGLRKALANRKTPRAFIPSLKKRLAKLTGAAIILFVLYGCAARSAIAQTPVTVQPSQQVLAPAGTACTGSVQTFTVNNRNQTQHNVSIKTTSVTGLSVQIFGQDSGGNLFLISDTGTIGAPSVGSNPILSANGYFPTIQVQVLCTPMTTGTFILSYSGTSASSNPQVVGGAQLTLEDKSIAQAAPANAGASASFQPPFGDSLGYFTVLYAPGAGPAGSTVGVVCVDASGSQTANFSFNLTTATLQVIPVPDASCPIATAVYGSGGATADTISIDYTFLQPGFKGTNSYTHIIGTTATTIKIGPGVVHTIVIGTPAAGTVTLFDIAPVLCTGTPVTGIVSVITATTTFPSAPMIYDSLFQNGICVKASAVMDITVNSQ
jgi:hypothetical protein